MSEHCPDCMSDHIPNVCESCIEKDSIITQLRQENQSTCGRCRALDLVVGEKEAEISALKAELEQAKEYYVKFVVAHNDATFCRKEMSDLEAKLTTAREALELALPEIYLKREPAYSKCKSALDQINKGSV